MMAALGMENGHLWMVIFWIAIIGGGIWLLAALFPRAGDPLESHAHLNGDALAILKRRYARGELTREEFEMIRQELAQAEDAIT